MPPETVAGAVCIKRWSNVLRQVSEGCETLLLGSPRTQMRKGGCVMVLNDVLQLLVVIGGTVGITFKISWAIFQEIHNNKK